MKYEVLVDFTDKENDHVYREGDKYPYKGRIKKFESKNFFQIRI